MADGQMFNVSESTTLQSMTDNMTEATDMVSTQTEEMTTGPRQMVRENALYEYRDFVISIEMYPIHTFIFCILGAIGNILALMVSLRKNMRGMSSSVFIATLSIFDIIALVGFMLGMVSLIYERHIISDSFCRAYFYLLSTGSMCSAYTVVFMSLERVLIVTFPLKAPNWTSRKRVLIVEVIYITFLALFNMHFFWTAIENPMEMICEYDYVKYTHFLGKWAIVDACIGSYGPLLLILLMNGIIIVQMHRASNIQKSMASNNQNTSKGRGSVNATNQITVMLLSISIAFLVFMTPYAIFQIYLQYILDPLTITYKKYAEIALINQFCTMFWEMNHSLNLVFYSLTGRKFRNELLSMFCIKMKEKPRSSSYATGTSTTATTVTKLPNYTNGATSATSVNTVSSAVM